MPDTLPSPKRHSGGPLSRDMKGLSSCCWGGKTSTLIGQMRKIERHLGVLLWKDMREWSNYYLAGKMSTLIFRMKVVEHRWGGCCQRI